MAITMGWKVGNDPISVNFIVSDELYDIVSAAPASPKTIINRGGNKPTYAEAYNYLFNDLVPAFAIALDQYNIPRRYNIPIVANGHTDLPRTPFGLVSFQMVSGTGSVRTTSPTNVNGPMIKTTWTANGAGTAIDYLSTPTWPYITGSASASNAVESEMEETAQVSLVPARMFSDGVYTSTSVISCVVSFQIRIYKFSSSSWRSEVLAIASVSSTSSITSLADSLLTGVKLVSNTDPYSQGSESDSEAPAGSSPFTGIGGNGSFTNPSFTGGVPTLPTLSAVDTGLLQLYCSPSAAGMNALAQFLWSSAFDIDTFKKLFTDPMDLIIGAAILPCTPANAASVILFGNINTGVSMPKATTQYVAVDCGTLTLTPRTGSFLDYAPHSKISIYLPYIGMRELNMTELIGKTIGVVYHVVVLTGACVAFVTANGVVLYEYSGSCAVQIPITSSNWASVLQSLATIGGSAIGGFAAGGPMGAVVAGGVSAASNAASGGLTPSFQRGGSVSGSAGLLADQNPYLVVELPNQCKASNQNWFEGYPNYTTMYLYQCSGYTKVHEINLEGIGCTRSELAEIETLLKGGVII